MKKIYFGIGFCASALLVLLCLAICVMTLLTGKVEGAFVREPITVSASPLDASHTQYGIQVRGILFNDGEKDIKVDAVKLKLRYENTEEVRELEGFVVAARSAYDLFYEWESEQPFDSVDRVELVVEGRAEALSNQAPSVLSVDMLLLLAVGVVFALLAVFFAKKYYYVYQEENMEGMKAQ